MPQTVCLSAAYLGPISYYCRLLSADRVWLEQWDHYTRQSYRNRCHILAANGVMPLSIPVEKGTGKSYTRDIRIADHGNWQHLHWNALVSAYGSSPFFDYYADDFRPYFEKRFMFLFDFDLQLQGLVCDLIGFEPQISLTECYRRQTIPGEIDLREAIHPKRDTDPAYIPTPYYQLFRDRFGFVPDLSILDLLFNMGPESLLVLEASGEGREQEG